MPRRDHEAWNEEMARRYNPDAFLNKSGFFIRSVGFLRLAAAERALDSGNQDTVLDLGCGPGHLLERLRGASIIGVDLSDTLLEMARQRVRHRPEVQVVKADAEHLPYPDNHFDRIVCSEVLEHVVDPAAVLKEIHRVAKPGMRVVLTVPNEGLINATKRVVLALGVKKWIAGGYDMSDDMLNQWHRAEIGVDWIMEHARGKFELIRSRGVPLSMLAYHRVLAFRVVK